MSEPIKVGDLVVVVRACCGAEKVVGLVRVVSKIENDRTKCFDCGRIFVGLHINNTQSKVAWGSPYEWFKRIPPLSELEGEKRKEELTA